jgi:hypothetical protein
MCAAVHLHKAYILPSLFACIPSGLSSNPSSFAMIRSAHWTAAVIILSERGEPFGVPKRSSGVLKCGAARIPAMIATTRLRPSSVPLPVILRHACAGWVDVPETGTRFATCEDTIFR